MKNVNILWMFVALMLFGMPALPQNSINDVKSISIASQQVFPTYGTVQTITFIITITPSGGNAGNGSTTISVNLPSTLTGANYTLSPTTLSLPSDSKATITVTLTITNNINTPANTYLINVSATSNPQAKTASLNYTINKLPISIVGASVASKVYDRTPEATINGSLSGIISPDVVNLNGTGTFASANVGNGINVTSTSTLSGDNAGNYSLTQPTGLTGTITAKPLTVSGASVTSKVFDGTTTATITGGSLVGVISPDVVSLTQAGTFSSANVGTGISVTSNCSISGTGAGNYSLTQPTGLTGNITKPTAVSWSGTTSTDWATPSNWAPPYLPDATIDATIPSVTNKPIIGASTQGAVNNITISSGASLTINPSGSLTVNGNLTNSAVAEGLKLFSGETTGTGSLIVYGTVTGQATLTRAMTPGAWHLVSSPVAGQLIPDFLSTNTTIPATVAASNMRAMREYLPATNEWGEFFTTGTGGTTGDLQTGKGYSMRVKNSTAHEVVFTGTLQAGDIPVTGLSESRWNCIGNPYTSAIGVTSSASSTLNFLTENAVTNINIDPAYGIYIWDKTDAYNGQGAQYTAISNASNIDNLHYLQQGQGFMVKMASGKSTVIFKKAMQVHEPSLTLKSTENAWPTIKLMALSDSASSSTLVAFHEGMTNGLDATYDAGLLKSGGSIDLYTRLVDDYGIPFAIQALPSDQYDHLTIPVGVDYGKGGKVSFSAQGFYLPTNCRPILEDRQRGILTDLTDRTYTTDLTANNTGTGRFFLHTSYATTASDSRDNAQPLSAWASGRQEININGKVNNGAMASLYDIQGRLIVTHAMREGIRHRISLPFLKPGIYLLQVRDRQKVQALKIAIGE